MAVIRCPNCGKPNPEFLELCQYCDTPLPAGDSPAGTPAEAARPGNNDDTLIRLPVWDTPADKPASAPAKAPAEEGEPLDWMERLRRRQEAEAAPPEPDWLWTGAAADASPRGPGEPATTPPAEMPDWLKDTSLDQAAAALPADAPPELPAWLRSGADPLPIDEPSPDETLPGRPPRKMTEWLNSIKAEANAPAAPATPPASTPAPVEPEPPAAKGNLPDWLQRLRSAPPPPPEQVTGTSSLVAHQRLQELPERARPTPAAPPAASPDDTLVNFRARSAPPATPPATTRATPPEAPAETPAAGPSAEEMPGWLRNILATHSAAATTGEDAAPAEAPAPKAPSASPDDTLVNFRPRSAPPAAAEQAAPSTAEPATGERPPAEPEAAPAAEAPKKKKMTDWLGSVLDRPREPEPTADEAMPSWLQSLSAEQAAAPAAGAAASAPAEALPEWLQSFSPSAAAPAAPSGSVVPEPPAAEEEEPPAWLNELPAAPTAGPVAGPQAGGATPTTAGDMPDWLKRMAPTAAATPPVAEVPPAAPVAPTSPAAEAPKAAEAAPTTAADMPDWLKRLSPPGTEPFGQPPAPPAPPAATAAPLGTGERPDWLSSLEPAAALVAPEDAPAPAEEMPAWMKDLAAAETLAAAEAAKAAPAVETPAAPAEDRPAWMKHVAAAEASAAAEPPAVAEPPAAAEPLAAAPATADMPAWMQHLEPADELPAAPAAAERVAPSTAEPATGDMPAWLTSMVPAASSEPAAGEIPAAPAAGPDSVTGDMPDWLKRMAPAGAGQPLTEPRSPGARGTGEMPDWLSSLTPVDTPSSTARVAQSMAEPSTDDMPAWMRDMAPTTLGATPPAAATPTEPAERAAQPTEDMPAWMRDMAPTTLSATPPAAVTPTAPPPSRTKSELEALMAADQPDWLRGQTPGAVGATEAVPAPEELPGWLKTLAAAQGPGAAAEMAAPEASSAEPISQPALAPAAPQFEAEAPSQPADIAGWLASLAAGEPGAEAGPAPLAPASAAPPTAAPVGAPATPVGTTPTAAGEPSAQALPAWLQSVGTGAQAETADDAMAWLETAATIGGDEAEPAEAAEAAPTPEGEVPGWLQALRTAPGEAAETQPDQMPDWLRSLRGLPARAEAEADASEDESEAEGATAAAPDAGPAASPEAAGLERGSLPAWLAAMRPIDIAHPGASEADSYEETLGVLAGMRGVLRAEPAVARPHTATPAAHTLAVSEVHTAHAQLLVDLAQADAIRLPARRVPARLAALAERWVIFALLAAAIWLAQFQFPGLFPAPSSISPETRAVYDLAHGLATDKPALLAFDYDAAQAGELSPGAAALARQLLARGVPVVAVSLRPTGAAVAQQVLTDGAAVATAGGLSETYGSQYLNLGYMPGGPVGLLQFAAVPRASFADDFTSSYGATWVWDAPAVAKVERLSDFGLIALISGSPETTRAWMEQAQAYAPDVPLVALVTASAEPLVRPYLQAPAGQTNAQLDGLVVGLGGAAQYEAQAGQPGAAIERWPALGGGLLAAAILIALGGLAFGGLGALRRTKR